MTAPPDNADVVARLRLELPTLATVGRLEMAARLITIALDALPSDVWQLAIERGIDPARGSDD